MKISAKQRFNIAYDLALAFTEDELEATELAEAIIRLCEDFCKEEDD